MSKRSKQRNRHRNGNGNGDGADEREDLESKIPEPEPLAVISAPGAPSGATPALLDRVAAFVERAKEAVPPPAVSYESDITRSNGDGSESKQPRFSDQRAGRVFQSVYRWVKIEALKDEPRANASLREWDGWLRDFVLLEPYLAGTYNSVVQIDKNRGWNLTGGRNQVNRYLRILHEADAGGGWRSYITWQAQSYYSTRLGFVTELGREGDGGPLRALWSVDPARCELTGVPEFPLKYYPANGQAQAWQVGDFFRAASLTSTDEARYGYGYPANARCFDLAKLMVALWEHDKEQLAARAPRGLMLLRGITQEQWDDAMQARSETLDSYERMYYGGVAVLASAGADEIQAQLVALSNLPKDFTLQQWVSLLMYGYALAYGYDAREFFPVDSGQLGSAKETEVQHRKASSKGDLDFSLAHQEQLQRQLPEALHFEYEQRDVGGETADANAALVKAQVITEMTKWLVNTSSVLSADQVLQLAAQAGLVPEEWTPQEEEVTGTDAETQADTTATERLLSIPRVRRAIDLFPDEPLVRYNSNTGQIKTLLPRAGDALERRSYPAVVARAKSVESIAATFRTALRGQIRLYCGGGSTAPLLDEQVRILVSGAVSDAYYAGLQQGGVTPEEFTADDSQEADRLVNDQFAFVDGFVQAVQDGCGDKSALYARVDLWVASVSAAGTAGVNRAKAAEMVEFRLVGDPSDESCTTCRKLLGQKHRRKWVVEHGYEVKPGNENFECGNWRCPHDWVAV